MKAKAAHWCSWIDDFEKMNLTKADAAITALPMIAASGCDFINVKGVAWMGENEQQCSGLETQHCYELRSDHVKVMTHATVFSPGKPSSVIEIRRGMTITSFEGKEAGRVAGVVVSSESQQAQYLILSHLPRKAMYQCIPVSWIERVQGEVISLNVRLETILALPDWHAS